MPLDADVSADLVAVAREAVSMAEADYLESLSTVSIENQTGAP
jgi:hypothetical protein